MSTATKTLLDKISSERCFAQHCVKFVSPGRDFPKPDNFVLRSQMLGGCSLHRIVLPRLPIGRTFFHTENRECCLQKTGDDLDAADA